MEAMDVISNIASHHGSMLAVGSLLAVLPVVLTLLGLPETDPHSYIDDDGELHSRSHPRLHFCIRLAGFGFAFLSGYSGYLTVATQSQDPATAGALFLNAVLLSSRMAKDVKWAWPAAAAGGAAVWMRFLQVMEASPDWYVSAAGWLIMSFVLLFPALYAERGVKFIGEATSYSVPAVLLGAVGGIQAVLLAMGASLTGVPPVLAEWLAQYLTEFGGF